jgi:nicotinamidase/pyrazinamidase
MKTILWEVDAQADFMLPAGKLYVPGAEKTIPNLNRLVEEARQGRVLLISSADAHEPADREFREWPVHCVKGTAGAELIPEARAINLLVIPNQENFAFPVDLGAYRQILLEKNTLDVFDNPNTDALLARLQAPREGRVKSNLGVLVFGVVTEYCVGLAADGLLRRGYDVSIIEDAIQSLDEKKASAMLEALQSRGARLTTTAEVLALLGRQAQEAMPAKMKKTAGN